MAALTFAALLTAAAAAPSDDRVLPTSQYTTEKARRLAAKHERALRTLNAHVYHCLPYLDIKKEGIGFFKPKHLGNDERYLALNVTVDQEPSPEFTKFSREERASRMFSRYVGPLLRRMTQDPTVLTDPAVDGFTVILSWLKQTPKDGERATMETMAVFMKKSIAAEYLTGKAPVSQLADSAHVLGWDGETAVGPLRVTAWEDDFVATFKVANYQLEPGVTCR